MKKFLIFISFLSVLILAEYFFLTEIFGQRRAAIIVITCIVLLICILAFVRFFKKSVYPTEHY